MKAEVKHRSGKRYVQVTYPAGFLSVSAIQQARTQAHPLFKEARTERVLVDFRAADLGKLSLLDIDTLALTLHDYAPDCKRGALLYRSDDAAHAKLVRHIANVCNICGVISEAFADPESAATWLCED